MYWIYLAYILWYRKKKLDKKVYDGAGVYTFPSHVKNRQHSPLPGSQTSLSPSVCCDGFSWHPRRTDWLTSFCSRVGNLHHLCVALFYFIQESIHSFYLSFLLFPNSFLFSICLESVHYFLSFKLDIPPPPLLDVIGCVWWKPSYSHRLLGITIITSCTVNLRK